MAALSPEKQTSSQACSPTNLGVSKGHWYRRSLLMNENLAILLTLWIFKGLRGLKKRSSVMNLFESQTTITSNGGIRQLALKRHRRG
jgi:hypothetical protein